ncbi:MAG: hypothetical protein WD738_24320 [Pirellulales bacterium]
MTTSCSSVGAHPERIASPSWRRGGGVHTSPHTWETLRELEKRPAGEPGLSTPILAAPRLILSCTAFGSISFRPIRLGDFTPASSLVKGVLASVWETLSIAIRKRARTAGYIETCAPRDDKNFFCEAS